MGEQGLLEDADKIIFAPKHYRFSAETLDELFIAFVKKKFIDMSFEKGENTSFQLFGQAVPLEVVDTVPSGRVKVTEKTEVEILREPIEE